MIELVRIGFVLMNSEVYIELSYICLVFFLSVEYWKEITFFICFVLFSSPPCFTLEFQIMSRKIFFTYLL